MSSNTFRCCSKFQYFSLTIVINTLANAILVQSPRKKLPQNHYKIQHLILSILFHFVYVYTLSVKKNVLPEKLISRRKHLLQHAMKFAVNEKITYCEKNQFEVFLAEVINFDVCQHKFVGHVLKPFRSYSNLMNFN